MHAETTRMSAHCTCTESWHQCWICFCCHVNVELSQTGWWSLTNGLRQSSKLHTKAHQTCDVTHSRFWRVESSTFLWLLMNTSWKTRPRCPRFVFIWFC